MKRTGVLWVAKGLGQGGMERLLVNHARFGDRDRFEYSAAYLVERPHNVIADLTGLGVNVHDLHGARTWSPGWIRRLVDLVRAEQIDVVHVQSPLVAAAVRPVLRAMPHRPRLLYTEHNSWENYRPATKAVHGLTFRLDDAHVAVSEPLVHSADEPEQERHDHNGGALGTSGQCHPHVSAGLQRRRRTVHDVREIRCRPSAQQVQGRQRNGAVGSGGKRESHRSQRPDPQRHVTGDRNLDSRARSRSDDWHELHRGVHRMPVNQRLDATCVP